MANLYPLRPADGLYLVDHFLTNDVITDNNIGQLGWQLTGIGNGSTLTYATGEAGAVGIMRSTTVVTADGDGVAVHLLPDSVVLDGSANGFFRFRARYPGITGNVLAGNNFRIGIDDSVTATDPVAGLSVESDAGVISLMAEGASGDVQQAVTGVSTLSSGTTMVLDSWHTFEVRWSGENAQGGPAVATLYVDGELGTSITNCEIDDDETMEPKIAHWQDSGSGDTLDLDVDYFELFMPLA
jgi:hypothetical protein